ncbi:MAG: hypothetical protein IPQ16_03720 [Geobacteraceae bacterium]|nr:hypothetical protein [Geobacteraceae bacterium]
MKKSRVAQLAILVLIASALSGCLWVVEEDGYGPGGGGRSNRGGNHGGHHGDHR